MCLEFSLAWETLAADRAVMKSRIVAFFHVLSQIAFVRKSLIAVSTWEWLRSYTKKLIVE